MVNFGGEIFVRCICNIMMSFFHNDFEIHETVLQISLLTLSLPVTRICVNFSTVYNDTLVTKGLVHICILYCPSYVV